jgi:lysozyme family protein
MIRNFERSLSLVLKHEGGFVNHPRDPGGATNLGITIATFRRYVNAKGTVDDLKRLTTAQAAKCYRKQYWDAIKGDDLPDGLDYAVFDFAVNSGPGRAAKHLQTALGVTPDGKIGPVTISAARDTFKAGTIAKLCDSRMAFLKGLKTWPTFGKGWTRRVSDVRRVALDMAGDAALGRVPAPPAPAKPVPAPVPPAKPSKPSQPVSDGWLAAFLAMLARIFPKGA